MKIRLVGAVLFHTDGWAKKMKLTVVFRSFANATKMRKYGRRDRTVR